MSSPGFHTEPSLRSRAFAAVAVAIVGVLAPLASATPIAITGAGSYSQNFDTLPSTGSATWTDDTTISGWYSQRTGTGTTIVADAGGNNGGGLYSYGAASATERALGTLGSGNAAAGSFAHGVLLQNTSGNGATINSLAYTGEEWRKGGVLVPQIVTLWYKISSSAITSLTPNIDTTWTAISPGDFSSPVNTATGTALDGNNTANRTAISINPNINVPAGNYVMIRWSDPDHTGIDHGLAIDDVALAWVANAAPAVAVSASLTNFSESAGAAASTGTVTIPAALGTDLTVTLLSSDVTEATVPATVTIALGNTSANFPINAVDDFLVDGSIGVTITATASGYLNGQVNITVEDDADAAIAVAITPDTFAENAGPAAAAGTVTIAANTVADLTVNLHSTLATEATVPASVTILAGQNTASFSVDAVNDTDVDGTRNVTIQATATGYTGGSKLIHVTDDGDTPPAPTLPVNAIAFTGYNADADDDLAFVVLSPIAAGDVILFSDNEWNGFPVGAGGAFNDSNEGLLTWTAPSGGVAVGTIVTLNSTDLASRSASVGTLTGSNFSLAAGGDTVYAFQGALLAPTRVLAAISAMDTDSIANTGLTDYVLLPNGTDIGAYNGSRTSQTSYLPGYLDLINAEANWIKQDTGGNDANDTIAPDVPFSTTAFTLSTGTTYASWATTNAGGGIAKDDFDGDGVSNGVEYFFGATGSTFTANPQPIGGIISYPHPAATPGAVGTIKTSPDLVTWTPVTSTESGGYLNYTLPTGAGKLFVRLEVEVTP